MSLSESVVRAVQSQAKGGFAARRARLENGAREIAIAKLVVEQLRPAAEVSASTAQ